MFKKQIIILLMLFASYATAKSICMNQTDASMAERVLQNSLMESPASIDDWGTVTINGSTYTMSSTSTLIDADIALLDLKAQGNAGTATVSASIGGTSYSGYQNVYNAVCQMLLDNATGKSGNIGSVAVSSDAIWKVTTTAYLNNQVTLNAGIRLVVCGEGTITRTASAGRFYIATSGNQRTLCLQGDLTLNGGGNTQYTYTNSIIDCGKGTVYISDDVKIQNSHAKYASSTVLNGGAITINDASAAVYMMGNALIDNCSSQSQATPTDSQYGVGGGVCLRDGTFKMLDNSKITNCKTGYNVKGYSLGGAIYMAAGTFEMNDNAAIQGCSANVGGAIYMAGGTFNMNGGLIGDKDAVVTWNTGETTVCPNLPQGDYPYITAIKTSTKSNKSCTASSIYAYNGQVNLNSGWIAGNESTAGSYNDLKPGIQEENLTGYNQYYGGCILTQGTTTLQCCEGVYVYGNLMQGPAIFLGARNAPANRANVFNGGKILCNWGKDNYGAGLGVTRDAVADLEGSTSISYNSINKNGGGLAVTSGSTVNLNSDDVHVDHNTAFGITETNSGNGGAFRVVGTLNIYAGTIAYNQALGTFDDDCGNGGAIHATTDNRSGVRIAIVNLQGGKIEHNKAERYGGGVFASSYLQGQTATFTLQGTEICHNSSDFDGGGCYLSALMGELKANLLNGKLSDNTANNNGGGLYFTILQQATKGTLNIDDTDPVKMMKIENNEANQNGGGIYLANEAAVVAPVTMYDGLVKGNTSVKGAGFYIDGGDVTVKSGNIDSNTASSDGGGCYVNGGDVSIESGTLSGNTSTSGGGIYVNGGNFTFTNGNVETNTASLNGGGAYISGGDVTFKGNLSGNTAANGGGLYLGPGASMEFQGGLIINNEANIPDGTTSAGTAYHGMSSNIMGCGGGIYLQNGPDSDHKTTLTFNLDQTDKTFGLYTNRANMAGDDLVAEGLNTEVVLPSVREMQLYGFEGKDATPFWYQDYFYEDKGYDLTNGHAVTDPVRHVDRFREIIKKYTNDYLDHRVGDDAANLDRIKNNYLCLTLSYNMLDITISAKYLLGHETALFRLVRHGGTEDYKYDVLLRGDKTDSTTGKTSRTLRNMPWGTYSIFPNDAWNWAYDKIAPQQNLRLGETGNYEFVFDMNHINDAEVPQHDERQPVKPSGN